MRDNRRQAIRFTEFMDSFAIPYTMVFGNHDCEMGATCKKRSLRRFTNRDATRFLRPDGKN